MPKRKREELTPEMYRRRLWLVEEMEFFWCERCDAFVCSPTCHVKVPWTMIRAGGSFASFQCAVWNMVDRARKAGLIGA